MPCETFEDRLIGYGQLSEPERQGVDAHLSTCTGCLEFLEALAQLDDSLTALYRGLEPHRVFDASAVRQPSALPEVLDFCGWAAVVAILAVLSVVVAPRFGIELMLPRYSGWYALGVSVIAAFAVLGSRFRRAPTRP